MDKGDVAYRSLSRQRRRFPIIDSLIVPLSHGAFLIGRRRRYPNRIHQACD